MKHLSYIVLLFMVTLSCKGIKNNRPKDCEQNKRKLIQSLSSYFEYNDTRSTYDLKMQLDSISQDVYEMFSDSLYFNGILPYKYSYNELQVYFLGMEFDKLQDMTCTVTLKDINTFFGNATFEGTSYQSNDPVLYFYFNLDKSKNCFNSENKRGNYQDCPLLSMIFDSNNELTSINRSSFVY